MSIYSSSLTRNSLRFTRDFGSGIYYYESIIIFVSINGLYHFRSHSSVDSCGYLYINYFNPFNLTENLLAYNDDSAGNAQFLIRYRLESNNKYILIKTTYYPNMTTLFSIIASGPARVYFNSINNTSTITQLPLTSTTTHCEYINIYCYY
jgi:hypothetical protein